MSGTRRTRDADVIVPVGSFVSERITVTVFRPFLSFALVFNPPLPTRSL